MQHHYELPAEADMAALHAEYKSGFAEHLDQQPSYAPLASSHTLGSFMPTGDATAQNAFASVPNVKRQAQVAGEHREDGASVDPVTGQVSYFNQQWQDEYELRYKLLTQDPEYHFIQLVAGFAGRPVEQLYNRDALDSHARRMLQRGAVAEELGKQALTDIDRTQNLLQKFEKRGSDLIQELQLLKRGIAELDFADNEWVRYFSTLLPSLEGRAYPAQSDAEKRRTQNAQDEVDRLEEMQPVTPALQNSIRDAKNQYEQFKAQRSFWGLTFDTRFTFVARCLYPAQGLDTLGFADRVLAALSVMSGDPAMIYIAASAEQAENVRAQASQHNPRYVNLAAYVTFLVHAANSTSACNYILRRMHEDKVFPAKGEYVKDKQGTLFCADLIKLASLLESDTTHAVTLKNMSARLFMHLRCMQRRWFGPPSDTDSDDPCTGQAKLQKPEVDRKKRAVKLFLTQVEGTEDEQLFYEESDDERSSLYIEQKRIRKSRGENEFQDLMAVLLDGFFRRGLATLVYDMARLRNLLCQSVTELNKSVLCEDVNEKMLLLRRVQPTNDLETATVTLSYFYGGMDLSKTGVRPMHVWNVNNAAVIDAPSRSVVYQFVRYTLMLAKRAMDSSTPFADLGADVNREWFFGDDINNLGDLTEMYNRHYQKFFEIVDCGSEARKAHLEQREAATYQAVGVMDVFIDIVRTFANLRDLHARFVSGGSIVFSSNKATDKTYLPVYLSEKDEKLLLLDCEKKLPEGCEPDYARALRQLLLRLERQRGKVFDDIERARLQLQEAARYLESQIRDLNKDLLDTEKGVMERVRKRYRVDIDANTSVNMVNNLKAVLMETYVPTPEWATAPENTGFIRLSEIYIAAVERSYEDVQTYVPHWRESTIDDLKASVVSQRLFAMLVASAIAATESDNPRSITLNRVPEDVVNRRRQIFERMRKKPPLTWTGRGTADGVERKTSSGQYYRSDGPVWDGRGPFNWAINRGNGVFNGAITPSGPRNIINGAAQPSRGGMWGALPRDDGRRQFSGMNRYDTALEQQRPKRARYELPSTPLTPAQVTARRGAAASSSSSSTTSTQADDKLQELQRAVERQDDLNAKLEADSNALRQKLRELENREAQLSRREQSVTARDQQSDDAVALQRQRAGRKKQNLSAIARAQEDAVEQVADEETQRALRSNLDRLKSEIENLTNTNAAVLKRDAEHTLLTWQARLVGVRALAHEAELRVAAAERRQAAAAQM